MAKDTSSSLGASRVTGILVSGSLYVSVIITCLLVVYDVSLLNSFRIRTLVGIAVIGYLSFTLWVARRNNIVTANWLLIILYQLIAGFSMLFWGLESIGGMITACFAVLLPGILMTPKHILSVAFLSFATILIVYFMHLNALVTPQPLDARTIPTVMDIVAYCTIIATFALVSWVSSYQSSKSLKRALRAEKRLRKQKELLSIELRKQSASLRQAQLQEMKQLYKFAIIGQSASATLHELSNHLSILNLDIDDIKQKYKNSKAIKNAQESIDYINVMVKKTRLQLGEQNNTSSFDLIPGLKQVLNDFLPKFDQCNVSFNKRIPRNQTTLKVHGDESNFIQIMTILLNNSLEACTPHPDKLITLCLTIKEKQVFITIEDNGPGIPPAIKNTLFQPVMSNKPKGLGVGLYIASHLMKTQFKGRITLVNSSEGAVFKLQFKKSSA